VVILVVILLFCIGGSMLINSMGGGVAGDTRVLERHFSGKAYAVDKVVILSIEGAILDGRGFAKRQIDRVRKDPAVKAIVLRVNSPGGSVTGSDYLHHHLSKLVADKKVPMVVSMGGMAASGGYYISMAAGPQPDIIYAEPTTWTGSIGVIIPHYEASQLLDKVGVAQDSVVSGKFKGMGSFARKMSDEERKILQELVDESFKRFKEIVKQGRPKFAQDPAALDKLATGQVFTTQQAVKNGLVDREGFLEDAVDRAVQLAGLKPDEVQVVEYKPEFSLADILLGAEGKQKGFDPAAIWEMSVPQAYYLNTWIPPFPPRREQ
jgi:protease-4